ncbi:hypothetical protein D3C80_1359750 [compost metagenome]
MQWKRKTNQDNLLTRMIVIERSNLKDQVTHRIIIPTDLFNRMAKITTRIVTLQSVVNQQMLKLRSLNPLNLYQPHPMNFIEQVIALTVPMAVVAGSLRCRLETVQIGNTVNLGKNRQLSQLSLVFSRGCSL